MSSRIRSRSLDQGSHDRMRRGLPGPLRFAAEGGRSRARQLPERRSARRRRVTARAAELDPADRALQAPSSRSPAAHDGRAAGCRRSTRGELGLERRRRPRPSPSRAASTPRRAVEGLGRNSMLLDAGPEPERRPPPGGVAAPSSVAVAARARAARRGRCRSRPQLDLGDGAGLGERRRARRGRAAGRRAGAGKSGTGALRMKRTCPAAACRRRRAREQARRPGRCASQRSTLATHRVGVERLAVLEADPAAQRRSPDRVAGAAARSARARPRPLAGLRRTARLWRETSGSWICREASRSARSSASSGSRVSIGPPTAIRSEPAGVGGIAPARGAVASPSSSPQPAASSAAREQRRRAAPESRSARAAPRRGLRS